MKKGLVYFLTILVVLGVLGVGAKFFVQQSAFVSSSVTVSSTGTLFMSKDSWWAQQTGFADPVGSCEVWDKIADCRLDHVKWGDDFAIMTDFDIPLIGWRDYKSCAGFMSFYGCDASKCKISGNTACTGTSSDSSGVQCSLSSDCKSASNGVCLAGTCVYGDDAKCTYTDYKCRGSGALYKCVNGQESFFGNIYSTRYGCLPDCQETQSNDLDAFCVPVPDAVLTPDEQNLQDITFGDGTVKDEIEESREWVEMPDPRCIFSFAECPTVKVPVIVDPLPVKVTNKTTTKIGGGTGGAGGLSWWTYFKLFAEANWILLVVLGGLVLTLVLTLTLTKKKRGR